MSRVPLIHPETGETVLACQKGAEVLIERGYEPHESVEVEPQPEVEVEPQPEVEVEPEPVEDEPEVDEDEE